jgi:phosphonate transport system permease protein
MHESGRIEMTNQQLEKLAVPLPRQWTLPSPYNAKHLLWVIAILALLLLTGKRTEMDKMVAMTSQAVSHLLGFESDSQVVRGFKRVANGMWPPVVSTQEEVSRISQFDRTDLPFGSEIVQQEITTQRMNLETLQMEKVVSSEEFLVRPFGYVWDVFIKMVETLEIALWGTLIAVALSLPLAYFATANYSPNRYVYTFSRGLISLFRSTPELIVALFLVLAYGFGPIAGVLALGLHAAGFLGKFYAEDIENADTKPQEAFEAIGSGKLKTLWYGVMPQVFPQYIAYTAYILDRNLRMATVIGLVGAGGIGQELKGRFDLFQYGHVMTILIAIFLFVFALDQLSARIRAKLI